MSFNISDYSVELISLKGFLESPEIRVFGRTVLEKGTVENGKILNKEKLKDSIQKLIKNPDFGKPKTKKIIFSIPESKTLFCTFELPKDLEGDEEEELNFIKREAEQTFPYSLEDLYLDFKINNKEVFLFAVPRETTDEFLEIFKDCKLEPVIFEPESESLFRSLIKGKKDPILIVDIGEKTTDFSVFNKGFLKTSISIETAGNKFTQSISEGLKVSFKEAQKLKEKFGLSPEKKQGKIFLILQKEVREIIDEIKKIEDYFKNKESKGLEKIILTGGSALLPCFSEYLAENLQKSVIIGSPLENINIDDLPNRKTFKMKSVIYSAAIGSALRGLDKDPENSGINLIKEIKNKTPKKRQTSETDLPSPKKSSARKLPRKKILIWIAVASAIGISAILAIKFVPGLFNSQEKKFENKEVPAVSPVLPEEELINPNPIPEPQGGLEVVSSSSEEKKEEEKGLEITNPKLKITDTPTGWLNVRDEASFDGKAITKVYPDEEYEYTDEKDGWYRIILQDKTEGWVFGGYIIKI
ncbi:MAG: pilus assembly protein PilM [Candidatus Nealsonbacteria bacterium]|nr:pilus assembly protein PilM [Candidatus Nealsonbacteria bacterium]